MSKEPKSAIAEILRENLPPNASRQQVYDMLGTYTPGYLSNLDSNNSGIGGRFRLGRKIFYPRDEVIKWVCEKVTAAR